MSPEITIVSVFTAASLTRIAPASAISVAGGAQNDSTNAKATTRSTWLAHQRRIRGISSVTIGRLISTGINIASNLTAKKGIVQNVIDCLILWVPGTGRLLASKIQVFDQLIPF